MADVKLNIAISKPKISTFRVAGKTLREVKKSLDAREEWGLYDATVNFKSSAKVDADGNVVSVTMAINPEIELPAWSGYSAATKEQKASWDTMTKPCKLTRTNTTPFRPSASKTSRRPSRQQRSLTPRR